MTPAQRAERALEVLKGRGYKLTLARRTVVEALAQRGEHLTAPEVVTAVGQLVPAVGRASVYRALELLTKLGLAQASSLGRVATTYALSRAGHHHHLVCLECHRTVEFEECGLVGLEGELARRLGYEIAGHLVEFYGRCPGCRGEGG